MGQLAVSGGQPLFTLGLPMFALSPVIAVGPQYQHRFFYSYIYISFEGHKQNLLKFSCRFKTCMGFKGQLLIKLEKSFNWGFRQLPLWCPFRNNLCKHAGGHSVISEVCTSLAWICVLWRSGSSLELSELCIQNASSLLKTILFAHKTTNLIRQMPLCDG